MIEYFDKMVFRDVPEEASEGEVYYRYLVELARRDREILLANQVIRRDRDMDSAFEIGARYLFVEVLGLTLIDMPGSDKPDGCFEIGRRGDLLMWDNKSKEDVYRFPASHLTQFKRYIRDSEKRVACFLIIVPSVDPGAAHVAAKLKVASGQDTDVALITAENLLWIAEEWTDKQNGKAFNPQILNITGILDQPTLKQRMSLFQ